MNIKKIIIIAAAVLVVAGAGFGVMKFAGAGRITGEPESRPVNISDLISTEESNLTESPADAESETVFTFFTTTETSLTETTAVTTTAAPSTTKPVTTKPVTTKPVTTRPVTTKPVTTTTTSAPKPVDYEGPTEVKSETVRENLKYGVVRSVTREIVYAINGDGSRTKVGTQNESVVYNRFNFSAEYADLLPAAKENASTYDSYISEVLRLTNKMRAEKGVAPLKLNSKLIEQANVRAEEIAWSGKHSHSRPGAMKFYTTIFRENGIDYGTSGENIGWGYATPLDVCNAWRNSETHYENIINPVFTEIGIGVAADCDPSAKLCWVQHFHSGV